jgi:enterochelin esterase family protein
VFAIDGHDFSAVDLVRYGPGRDLQFWMDVGTLEELLEDNRRMIALLDKRQYNVTYREFSGGHNYTAWRDDVWRGLEAMFPYSPR